MAYTISNNTAQPISVKTFAPYLGAEYGERVFKPHSETECWLTEDGAVSFDSYPIEFDNGGHNGAWFDETLCGSIDNFIATGLTVPDDLVTAYRAKATQKAAEGAAWEAKKREEQDAKDKFIATKTAANLRDVKITMDMVESSLLHDTWTELSAHDDFKVYLSLNLLFDSIDRGVVTGSYYDCDHDQEEEGEEEENEEPEVEVKIRGDKDTSDSVVVYVTVTANRKDIIRFIRNPDKIVQMLESYNEDGFKITVQK